MTTPDPATDDDRPLDPQAMLDLIADEDRAMRRATTASVPVFYYAWGVAWLVGYLVLWASWTESGAPIVIPGAIAVPVFTALIVGAAALSAVVGIRMNRGIRGTSRRVGMIYGWSWTILGTAAAALGVAMIRAGMPPELAALYFPSVYMFIVAALYLAGAMLWGSNDQLMIAVLFAIVGAVAPFFGAPTHYLVMSLLGGGALLVGGVVASIAARR